MSRRTGETSALGKEVFPCPLCQVGLSFERELPFFTEGNLFENMYTGTKETGTRVEANVPRFQYNRYKYIFIRPVGRAHYKPDVILIYGDSTQMMRLVHAGHLEEGAALTSSFMGRYDCADYTAGVVNSGKYQVISHCEGDRIFGLVQDFKTAFFILSNQIKKMITGLQRTHQGGGPLPPPFLYELGSYLSAKIC